MVLVCYESRAYVCLALDEINHPLCQRLFAIALLRIWCVTLHASCTEGNTVRWALCMGIFHTSLLERTAAVVVGTLHVVRASLALTNGMCWHTISLLPFILEFNAKMIQLENGVPEIQVTAAFNFSAAIGSHDCKTEWASTETTSR